MKHLIIFNMEVWKIISSDKKNKQTGKHWPDIICQVMSHMSPQVLHTVLLALFKTQEQISFKRKEEIRWDGEKQKESWSEFKEWTLRGQILYN